MLYATETWIKPNTMMNDSVQLLQFATCEGYFHRNKMKVLIAHANAITCSKFVITGMAKSKCRVYVDIDYVCHHLHTDPLQRISLHHYQAWGQRHQSQSSQPWLTTSTDNCVAKISDTNASFCSFYLNFFTLYLILLAWANHVLQISC